MKKLPKQTKGLIYKIIYMFRAHTKKKKHGPLGPV